MTVSSQGVHTLTAQATNSGATGVSNSLVDLVSASISLSGGGQIVLFSGSSDAVTLSDTGGTPDTVTGSGGTVTLSNAQAMVTGTDAITFSGIDVLTLAQAYSGMLSGFASGDKIALPLLAYKSSYEAAYYASASGGTLDLLDTANGNAVAASLPFSGSFAGEAFTLSADPVAGTDITLSAASWANPQPGDVLFTNVPGQAYSAYQYDYTAGSFVGSQFYYTANTGKPYAVEEIDYNGGGQLTRAAFSGVRGQPYSAYEYDYVGGVFAGSQYTFTSVPAGAGYSSYVVDQSPSNTFAGEQFYFTNVQGQSYTGEEMDFNASVGLTPRAADGRSEPGLFLARTRLCGRRLHWLQGLLHRHRGPELHERRSGCVRLEPARKGNLFGHDLHALFVGRAGLHGGRALRCDLRLHQCFGAALHRLSGDGGRERQRS